MLRKLIKTSWNLIYLYLGVGFIHQLTFRHKKFENQEQKPSQVLFWAFGIYSVFFGLALQRYELKVNRIVIRYSAYVDQLNENVSEEILQGLVNLQNETVPIEPILFSASSINTFWRSEPFELTRNDIAYIAQNYFSSQNVKQLNDFHSENLILKNLDNKTFFSFSAANVEIMGSSNLELLFKDGVENIHIDSVANTIITIGDEWDFEPDGSLKLSGFFGLATGSSFSGSSIELPAMCSNATFYAIHLDIPAYITFFSEDRLQKLYDNCIFNVDKTIDLNLDQAPILLNTGGSNDLALVLEAIKKDEKYLEQNPVFPPIFINCKFVISEEKDASLYSAIHFNSLINGERFSNIDSITLELKVKEFYQYYGR